MATIKISDKIYESLISRFKESGFRSVDEYVESILKDFFKDNIYSKEDEEKVKDRLKALGYL